MPEEQQPVTKQDSNKALYISGAVVLLLVFGLFTNGFGLFNKGITANVTQQPTQFVPLGIGQAPVLGDINAPVTIYEFSDFSCPFCSAAAGFNLEYAKSLKSSDSSWTAPLPQVEEQYIKTGKAKLVFKYSLGHGTGEAAHRVGWCLNDQNLFWKFHDRAFAQQEETGDLEKMKAIAGDIGANITALDACLSSNKYNSLFQQDTAMGKSNGVKGTPAFFINGNLVEGAQSFSTLQKIIEKELKK